MLDVIVSVILGAALVTFLCLGSKTQKQTPEVKKGPKRDSKGRFVK